ncbi:MAG: ABC transporter permease [Microbacteriaceae bacterium]|nr:ABC transporter permease [Microbacteriaceae bacterium]
MTTLTRTQDAQSPIVLEKAEIRSWKAPIALAVFVAIGAVIFIGFGREGESTFVLSRRGDAIQLPAIVAPTLATCIAIVLLLAAITAWSAYLSYRAHKTPVWALGAFGFLFVVGFLTWAAAGASLPVSGLLIGTLGISVPLIFGALGGVISERAGVVNVAIEGQLLAGAFVAAVVASVTRQPLLGLAAAMLAGVLVSFVLAAFAIKYLVDQVIVGVVLNVLVAGLTSFLFSQVLTEDTALLNSPPGFDPINIPILSEIPILGPVLFRQTIIVYVMYFAIAAVWFGLYRTRWGLRVRSVGEHPQAADTVGINVASTRFWNVSLAGAIAGFGGAYLTLDAVGSFNKEMTAGAGFIALAAVIFGRWDPIKATLAALLFGFATNLQNVLSIIGSPVPSEFMLMLPYVVTIFAVAGLVGKSRPPAADGKPYIKS